MRNCNRAPIVVAALVLLGPGCTEPDDKTIPCGDGTRNGAETGVDCGGSCLPCVEGEGCLVDADCRSRSCVSGSCAPPACTDGRKNGFETDLDCGGRCPARCAVGQACNTGRDCASGICEESTCRAAPSCLDGIRNGPETDVDCGGGACLPCGLDAGCGSDGDCASRACDGGRCIPSCDNGLRDGDETDRDCGGSCARACAEGRFCREDRDCRNGVCAPSGICDAGSQGSCSDGVQNAGETDVDCGGGLCAPCQLGHACEFDEDCASGFGVGTGCVDGICGGPSVCWDGRRNGHETGLDCGGRFCRPCLGGWSCLEDADCFSGACELGICTTPPDTCGDGERNGFETDVDCGGACPGCPDGYTCGSGADCETSYCDVDMCGGLFLCMDGAKNGKETDIDCGGGACPPCRGGGACLVGSDCGSGICEPTGCAAEGPGCHDGVLGETETGIDCGGPGCLPCSEGLGCLEPADCTTAHCARQVCSVSVASLQRAEASVACSASGTILPRVDLRQLVVGTGRFELDAETFGHYLQEDQALWPLGADVPEAGIVLALDRSRDVTLSPGDVVDVVGELRESDCETQVYVGPASGSVTPTGDWGFVRPLEVSASTLTDPTAAERYEGNLVVLYRVSVTDVSGYEGPEGPGNPRWWIRVGPGLPVAADFPLGEKPALGHEFQYLRGFVKYRHGVYLLVPRDPQDLGSAPGGRE
jgi:hypothetical protein